MKKLKRESGKHEWIDRREEERKKDRNGGMTERKEENREYSLLGFTLGRD